MYIRRRMSTGRQEGRLRSVKDLRVSEQHHQDRRVPPDHVTVQRGPTLDGIGNYYAETIEISDPGAVDVVKVLNDANVDVMVSTAGGF